MHVTSMASQISSKAPRLKLMSGNGASFSLKKMRDLPLEILWIETEGQTLGDPRLDGWSSRIEKNLRRKCYPTAYALPLSMDRGTVHILLVHENDHVQKSSNSLPRVYLLLLIGRRFGTETCNCHILFHPQGVQGSLYKSQPTPHFHEAHWSNHLGRSLVEYEIVDAGWKITDKFWN